MATTSSISDRRAAVRYQLTTKGLLRAAGRMVEFKTFDVSALGAGIWHADPVPPSANPVKMLLTLPMNSGTVKVESDAEVRYSVHSKGGYRSGLLFRNLTPAQNTLLALALKGRLPVLETGN